MDITYRTLEPRDIPAMWQINEEGLPAVGEVSQEALADLLSLCELPIGAYRGASLVGFVLCLLPGTRYGSLNYAWFHGRYGDFLYVDRIAVSADARDHGVGTGLYERVTAYAAEREWPVAAEVSASPPNPGSMRFHGRHGFGAVGQLEHPAQTVAMMLRPARADRAQA